MLPLVMGAMLLMNVASMGMQFYQQSQANALQEKFMTQMQANNQYGMDLFKQMQGQLMPEGTAYPNLGTPPQAVG